MSKILVGLSLFFLAFISISSSEHTIILRHINSTILNKEHIPSIYKNNFKYWSKVVIKKSEKLEEIKFNLFTHASNLKTIDLEEIENFDFPEDGVFLLQTKVQKLNVIQSGVTKIYEKTFAKMPNLEKINLSDNKINSLDKNAFQYNTKLKSITLNNNQLSKIDSDLFIHSRKFVKLLMEGNPQFNFPADDIFLNSPSLKYFGCYQCGVTQIYKDTFGKMPKLTELDLQNNQLSIIDANAFTNNYLGLTYLDIDRNPLKMLECDMLLKMTNLDRLYISDAAYAMNLDGKKENGETFYSLAILKENCKTDESDKTEKIEDNMINN